MLKYHFAFRVQNQFVYHNRYFSTRSSHEVYGSTDFRGYVGVQFDPRTGTYYATPNVYCSIILEALFSHAFVSLNFIERWNQKVNKLLFEIEHVYLMILIILNDVMHGLLEPRKVIDLFVLQMYHLNFFFKYANENTA